MFPPGAFAMLELDRRPRVVGRRTMISTTSAGDPMQITAAVMNHADSTLRSREIALESVELDAPRADEVLVRVTHAGVCGTDRGCIHGLEPYPTPGVLGHEGAGIVEALGRDVRSFKPGDRVMIGFPYCGLRGLPRGRAALLRPRAGAFVQRTSPRRLGRDDAT
jgi:NADPH:quinone reductase-like Zn-dependent oxidoreductase